MRTLNIIVLTLLLAACATERPQTIVGGKQPWPVAQIKPNQPPTSNPVGFNKTLTLQGISFHVTCPNNSSLNRLSIRPGGLEVDNAPMDREIDGSVTGAEVADLDADGSPELYIYVNSVGSGSYGSLVAYAANKRKSLSEIYLPPIDEDKKASQGYMGHDEFAVVENRLVRRFPLYRDGDSNVSPRGGTRQLQYKLAPGETGWILKLDRTVDY